VGPHFASTSYFGCVDISRNILPDQITTRSSFVWAVFSAAANAELREVLICMVQNTALDRALVQTVVIKLRSEVEIVYTCILGVVSCSLSDLRFFSCSSVLQLILKSIKRTSTLTSQLLDCLSLIVCACVVFHVFIVYVDW
jgi:hypothetical protein